MPQCPIAGDRDANARNSQTTDYDLPHIYSPLYFRPEFSSSFFFFLLFSSPNLSGRRLDVYHT